jgi:hypothetical protein
VPSQQAPSQPANWLPSLGFIRIDNRQAADEGNGLRWSDDGAGWGWKVSIVGLWHAQFISKGTTGIPDGTVFVDAFVSWHSDGTEIMNSGRAPKTQSFCTGVWKQVGRSSFRLHHVTLSWDDSGNSFVGPGAIHEQVTVDRSGNRYQGTFTIDQFGLDGTTVLAHLQGTVQATRVTVD